MQSESPFLENTESPAHVAGSVGHAPLATGFVSDRGRSLQVGVNLPGRLCLEDSRKGTYFVHEAWTHHPLGGSLHT